MNELIRIFFKQKLFNRIIYVLKIMIKSIYLFINKTLLLQILKFFKIIT